MKLSVSKQVQSSPKRTRKVFPYGINLTYKEKGKPKVLISLPIKSTYSREVLEESYRFLSQYGIGDPRTIHYRSALVDTVKTKDHVVVLSIEVFHIERNTIKVLVKYHNNENLLHW